MSVISKEILEKVEQLISALTIDEKLSLVQGTQFWKTNAVERLGIPSIVMADGPHGLRKQSADADHLGLNLSEPATCFPTASTVASSFNPENARKMGAGIARECNYHGVDVLLGPGVNIKRNPLCGRNFEYYSEDARLSGEMGKAFIEGVQKTGVGACVKHFAANNSENFRLGGNSVVDERALREVYIKSFEIALEAEPDCVMSAYNRLNGKLCSESRPLLTERLREQLGYKGMVMSDWGAVADRTAALNAGLDLEMPGDTKEYTAALKHAVLDEVLGKDVLDDAVRRVLTLVLTREKREQKTHPKKENHALAIEIAKDSAVLMKNNGALPIQRGERLFIAGELFSKMRYQGAGSSLINPTELSSPEDAFDRVKAEYQYEAGYLVSTDKRDAELFDRAIKADNYDKIIFFCGLTEDYESEGYDRKTMLLPQNQVELLDELVKKGKPIVLVLFGGAPFVIPHFDKVDAVLNMYLPGQGGGEAVRSLLYGESCPTGKLAETWAKSYADVPFSEEFSTTEVEAYRESIFVGYKYYDHAKVEPLCPFGFGLSYTQFSYSDLYINRVEDTFQISCNIKNIGSMRGAEVVQLYLGRNDNSGTFKPVKTLRGFQKIYLEPNETATAEFEFHTSDFVFYDIFAGRERLEAGFYNIYMGNSSRDIWFEFQIEVLGEGAALCPPVILDAYKDGKVLGSNDGVFQLLAGSGLSRIQSDKLTLDSRFMEIKRTFFGKFIYNGTLSTFKKRLKKAQDLPLDQRINEERAVMFLIRAIDYTTPRMAFCASGGKITLHQAQSIVDFANGSLSAGLRLFKILKKNDF